MNKIGIFYILLTFLMIINPCESIAQNTKSQNSLIDAVQYIEDNHPEKAIPILNEIKKINPNNDAVYYYLAKAYIGLKQYEIAQADLYKANQLVPNNYWYKLHLGLIYKFRKQYPKAIKILNELSRKYPKEEDVNLNLALSYIANNQPDKAIKTIDKFSVAVGNNPNMEIFKYQCRLMEGKNEEAFNKLKEYNENNPNPNIYCILANQKRNVLNTPQAIKYYREAIKLDEGNPDAILGLADIYNSTGEYPKTVSLLDSNYMNKRIPNKAMSLYLKKLIFNNNFYPTDTTKTDVLMNNMLKTHIGDTSFSLPILLYYYATKRPERTINIGKSIYEQDTTNINNLLIYAKTLLSLNKNEELLKLCENAEKRHFKNNLILIDLENSVLINMKKYQKIIDNCNRIIDFSQGKDSVLVNCYSIIGDVYYEMGDSNKAFKAYDKALKINKDYAPVLNNYAYYLSQNKLSLRKAYKLSKRTIELEPNNPTYLDTFGWILYLQGKALEAKPFFKQAILYGGKESPDILRHYSEVLKALGENDLSDFYKSQAEDLNKQN